jgi:hypothetical protein
MMRKLLLVCGFIVLAFASMGQEVFEAPKCGADAYLQLLRKDPMYVSRENVLNEKIIVKPGKKTEIYFLFPIIGDCFHESK